MVNQFFPTGFFSGAKTMLMRSTALCALVLSMSGCAQIYSDEPVIKFSARSTNEQVITFVGTDAEDTALGLAQNGGNNDAEDTGASDNNGGDTTGPLSGEADGGSDGTDGGDTGGDTGTGTDGDADGGSDDTDGGDTGGSDGDGSDDSGSDGEGSDTDGSDSDSDGAADDNSEVRTAAKKEAKKLEGQAKRKAERAAGFDDEDPRKARVEAQAEDLRERAGDARKKADDLVAAWREERDAAADTDN